jgi:hypothetical protein
MDMIRKLWWGLYPLPLTFWGFYVLGFIALMIVTSIAFAALVSFFPALRTLLLMVGLVIIWAYWITASVGVWRSANDSKRYIAFWRYSARAVILLYALMFANGVVERFAVH